MQGLWKGLFALSTMLSLLTSVPALGQEVTLRLFSDGGPASPYGAGAAAFAEEVTRRTGGRYRIEPVLGLRAVGQVLGPNRAVGRGLLDTVRSGEADLSIMSAAPLGTYAPSVLVLDVPFLFRDAQHARAVLDGSVGQELLAKLPEPGGVIGLAWSETGVRHLTNNQRPVRGPDDLKGLTIRVQENEVHQQAFRALGANVVAMPLGQLQAAIEQGTVNGQENPLWVLMLTRLPQVQKHLSLTGHVYNAGIVVMSKSAHERLSPNDRNAFVEAAQSAALATRRKIDELEANGLTQLRNSGLEIIEEVDRGAFQRALQPLTLEWRRRFGAELIDRIQAAK